VVLRVDDEPLPEVRREQVRASLALPAPRGADEDDPLSVSNRWGMLLLVLLLVLWLLGFVFAAGNDFGTVYVVGAFCSFVTVLVVQHV
jgi:hypothetical protein